MLRWSIGAVIGLLLVVLGVQLFLWSSWPRQIGISVAQKITGLRIEMGSLSIGWFGDTSITDLAVSLPLEDKPFLTVPRVDVKHTSLVGIVLTRDVVIRRAVVQGPGIDIRQDKSGAWNIQQALNQISGPAQNVATVEPEARGAANIYLPDVDLSNAVATITTRDGRSVRLGDLALKATHEGQLTWRFFANAGALADAAGSVTPVGRWPHDVRVNIDSALAKQLKPLLGDGLAEHTVRLKADWSGERTATGVTGRLTIPENGAEAGPVRARGATQITLDGGDVRVEPASFKIDVAGVPTVELAGGALSYSGSNVAADGLRVRFADGSIRITSAVDLAAQQAKIDASWERVAFPAGAQHAGRFVLDVANVWPGKPQLSASLEARGDGVGRSFDVRVNVAGSGQRWTDADYIVDFARTSVSNDRGVSAALQGAKLILHNTADTVELLRIETPQRAGTPLAEARGAIAFAGERSGEWWLWSSLRAAPQTVPDYRGHVSAYGDGTGVTLSSAYAAIGADVWANVMGRYRFNDPEPVILQADLEADPSAVADADTRAGLQMKGRLGGSVQVGGTLTPLNLKVAGHARSRAFKFRDFDLGDTDLQIEGVMLDEYVNIETRQLALFGGGGWLAVKYPYFTEDLLAQITFERFALRDIAQAGGVEGIAGTARGSLAFNVPLASPRSVRGGGEIVVDSFAAPMVAAKSVRVPIRVRNEWIDIAPEATQEKGGIAKMGLVTTFAEPTRLSVKASLQDWLTVLPLRDLYTRTGGSIDLSADLRQQTAAGRVELDSVVGAHESEIGNASLIVGVEGRTATLERLTGQVLQGVIFGEGAINVDEPERGRLSLGVNNISLDRLAELAPQVGDVKGNLSVRLHAEPARGDRPLGPLEARFNIDSDRATYKGIEIGNTRIRAFVDRDRAVLSDDPDKPNQLAIAGGTVRLWGRVSGVPIPTPADLNADPAARVKKQPSVFLQLRPENIDTEQLNQIIDPKSKPVPGRVSGEVTAFGNPFDYKGLSGSGRIKIENSDFANVGLFSALYDAMRLGVGAGDARGYGNLSFRLQGGRLEVPDFTYFNRGVYATASLSLGDVFAFKASPVNGFVIGTARPLKDLDLPFLPDLDKILDALQRGATTLRVDGTLGAIKASSAALKDVSADFRNMLIGKTKEGR